MPRLPLVLAGPLLALGLSACAGSTAFVGECPDGGLDNDCDRPSLARPDLTLTPGGSGQKQLTLLVEGAHAGTFDFAATPDVDSKLSATVSPTTAELKSGESQRLLVTVTAASDAPAASAASVFVTARPKGGSERDGAGRAIFVKVVVP